MAFTVVGSSLLATALSAAPANAAPPIGTCTSSYQAYTFGELAAIDPAVTAALFSLINTNHDEVICFKPYPNGDHHGHGGNLVDNKAAPHVS
jgi:hypothetical protein